MELNASALEGSKFGWVVWGLGQCEGPTAVKLRMKLWGWKYECVARGRQACSLPRLEGIRPTKKPVSQG